MTKDSWKSESRSSSHGCPGPGPANVPQYFENRTDEPPILWHPGLGDDPGPWTSHYERVLRTGMPLPAAETLSDSQVQRRLRKLLRRLEQLQVMLMFTEHLSDRELYRRLTEETLHDRIRDMKFDPDQMFVLGLLNLMKHQDLRIFLRFYASEEDRFDYSERFPGCDLPPRERPPFPRDRRPPLRGWDPHRLN